MRIVQLALYSSPYSGSFVSMLGAAARAARRRAWSTELVLPPAAAGRAWIEKLPDLGLPARFISTDSWREAGAAISRILRETSEPTVLHTHFTRYDVPAAIAALRRPHTPVVWHRHNDLSPTLRARTRAGLKYAVLGRGVDLVLCGAENIAESVRARGAPSGRVLFFPNAIETDRFPEVSSDERRAARRALGVSDDETVLLHFGWDWYRKGGDLLLEASADLLRRGRRLRVVSVRGGEQGRSLAAELGVDACFVDLPHAEDVRSLYAFADVFVSCSRSEATTFAVAEALCCGVPVCASAIPGHTYQCEGLDACRLTELSAEAVSAGIESLLDRDEDVARREQAAARASVVDRLDLEAWGERLTGVYSALLGVD